MAVLSCQEQQEIYLCMQFLGFLISMTITIFIVLMLTYTHRFQAIRCDFVSMKVLLDEGYLRECRYVSICIWSQISTTKVQNIHTKCQIMVNICIVLGIYRYIVIIIFLLLMLL